MLMSILSVLATISSSEQKTGQPVFPVLLTSYSAKQNQHYPIYIVQEENILVTYISMLLFVKTMIANGVLREILSEVYLKGSLVMHW